MYVFSQVLFFFFFFFFQHADIIFIRSTKVVCVWINFDACFFSVMNSFADIIVRVL